MANIEQDTNRMAREFRQLWQVRNFFAAELELRFFDDTFHGPGGQGLELRQNYLNMGLYMNLFEDRYRETWRRMRRWSREYAAIPDAFEGNLGPNQRKICRCMTTLNRLTNAQLDAGETASVDEAFLTSGNRFENGWAVLDCFIDFLICFQGRAAGWASRWEGRGPAPRRPAHPPGAARCTCARRTATA